MTNYYSFQSESRTAASAENAHAYIQRRSVLAKADVIAYQSISVYGEPTTQAVGEVQHSQPTSETVTITSTTSAANSNPLFAPEEVTPSTLSDEERMLAEARKAIEESGAYDEVA